MAASYEGQPAYHSGLQISSPGFSPVIVNAKRKPGSSIRIIYQPERASVRFLLQEAQARIIYQDHLSAGTR
jgi:hypothetical protein